MAAAGTAVGIRALLFDLDNTLIDTAGAGRQAERQVKNLLISRHGYEESAADLIIEKFNTKLEKERADSSTEIDIDEERTLFLELAIQETNGHKLDQGLATECYLLWKSTRLQNIHIPDEVQAMLRELHQSYKLLLLTNGSSSVQREKINVCQCEQYFDLIVIGGEHQEQKPARSIFQECFRLLGVKPDACVMIGDNLKTDIEGGVNAGVCATIWINNNNGKLDKESAVPDYTVKSVLDVKGILENIKCKF
ncbi:N-acylneuraminate-9-phosphatase isoform X1 [Carcharodon carcharias]|uniref:N-acylneuraminate-9-phosphatase isoform X1 n=1 Tax=Carcharodon carcharias TaxID=13397 RepID=UPI001B7DE19D|nr:N-acylneuraminate-9-phosphatase isoform X1 [Carcharodon carcharias]